MPQHDSATTRRLSISIPLSISITYVIVGSLWILLSDTLVATLVSDPAILTYIGMLKGSFYTAFTGFLIFVLVRRDVLTLERSRQELSATRVRYGELVENVNSIILRIDIEGRITFMNDFGLRFFGFSADEILGRNVLGTIVPERDSQGNDLSELVHQALRHPEDHTAIENENIRSDGRRVWVVWSNKPIYDAEGALIEIFCVGNDATTRKGMEEALLRAEKMYRFLAEESPLGIMILEGNPPRAVFLNRCGTEIVGYSAEEVRAMSPGELLDIIHPDDRSAVSKGNRRRLRGEPVDSRQHMRFVAKDGTIRWVEAFLNVIAYGETPVTQGTFIDITEKKAAETALQQSEEHYRALFKSANDAILLLKDDVIVDCNPVAERMFQLSRDEMVARGLEALSPRLQPNGSESQVLAREILASTLPGRGRLLRWTLNRSGGTIFETEVSLNAFEVSGVHYALAIVRDITERNQIETRLRETNEYLENILNHSPDAICIADASGRFIRMNRAAEQLFGFAPGAITERTIHDLYAESAQHERILAELDASGLVRSREVIAHRADGSTFPVELSISQLRDESGSSVGTISIARDISEIKMTNEMLRREIAERLKTEEALTRSQNLYRAVFRYTGSATVIIEQDGTFSMVNPEFEHLSGYTREELEGRTHWEFFVADEDLERLRMYHRQRRIEPAAVPNKYEFTFVNRKGERRHVFCVIGLIPDSGAAVSSLVDVTEKRRLEDQLFKADKLESIGVLAGGIAHDFNNILTGILGNISLARLTAPAEAPMLRPLEEAERAVTRARSLTAQLLTFSKGGDPVRKAVPVAELVGQAADMALRGSNVGCAIETDDEPWLIEADAGQVTQALANVIINARQAMPAGGVVSIRVKNMHIEGPQSIHPLPGKYVRISITDHGTGIPSEHLDKIFDPFFSTRPTASGLGLATAYSVVTKHGGTIDVDSRPGVGTTFHIDLPASSSQASPERHGASPEPAREARILVMDDEAMIRDTAARMLEVLGFRAESAPDGRQAIELYTAAAEAGDPFDAVILDLTIPGGMGGAETNQALHALDPSALTIASSGYSNDPIMANCVEYAFAGVIEKPYRVQELADVMKSVLGHAGKN